MPTAKKTSKSDFVRQHPSLKAAEVVAKAKEAGIKLTGALVYKVRGRTTTKGAKKATPKKSAAKQVPSKNATPKKTTSKAAKPTASAFIRSLPSSTPVADVIKQGAASGYSFKANLVYAVRSASSKKKSGRKTSKAVVTTKATRSSAAISDAMSPTAILSRLVVEHGVGHVRALLGQIIPAGGVSPNFG